MPRKKKATAAATKKRPRGPQPPAGSVPEGYRYANSSMGARTVQGTATGPAKSLRLAFSTPTYPDPMAGPGITFTAGDLWALYNRLAQLGIPEARALVRAFEDLRFTLVRIDPASAFAAYDMLWGWLGGMLAYDDVDAGLEDRLTAYCYSMMRLKLLKLSDAAELVTTVTGEPIDPATLRARIYRWSRRQNLPPISAGVPAGFDTKMSDKLPES